MKIIICRHCQQEYTAPLNSFKWTCCTNCQLPNSLETEELEFKALAIERPFENEIFPGNVVYGKNVTYTCVGGIRFHAVSCIQTIGWFVNENGEGCWAYDGTGFLCALTKEGSLTSKALRSKSGGDIVSSDDWQFRIHRMVEFKAISCFGTFPHFEGLKSNCILISGFTPNQEFVFVFVFERNLIRYFTGSTSFKNEIGQFIQPFNDNING